jgi:hypothetical protein
VCAALLLAPAACSGGGASAVSTAPSATPGPAPSPSASAGAGTATLSFHIPLPSSSESSRIRSRRPRYIGKTTREIVILISGGPGGTTNYPTIVAKKRCDGTGCYFAATDSLPVQPDPYTFAFSARGAHGALSQGTVVQTLVRGANSVDVTLSPIVATASIAVPHASPVPGGPSGQTFAVSVTPFDADDNAIGGTDPFSQPLSISVFEVDNQAAFVVTAAQPGSADCSEFPGVTCNLRSNADSVVLVYNGGAGGFPTDPGYYPAEAILYNGNPNGVGNLAITASNSADVATPRCTKPAPLCVYARPYYPLLLAGLNPTATGVIFPATFVTANGATIWTDVGTIATSGSTPVFAPDAAAYGQQISGGLQYVAATGTAFTVDYSGSTPRLIDSVARSGAVAPFAYASDTVNTSTPQGGGIIAAPDGNVWWIDPATGSLRYANPKSPTNAKICTLAPATASQILSAAQIVATPAGVAPARIWFSAIDNVSSQVYVGYLSVSAGSNSCGNALYANIDGGATNGPPNGLAVDERGNAWYDDAGASFTAIGEVSAGASGSPSAGTPVGLPAVFVGQAWGILLNPADGALYFVDDNGTLGRFDPARGPASAAAFALPGPLANTLDLVSGSSFNSAGGDGSCSAVLTNLAGPCFPQFAWDAGSGGAGRLTLVIPGTEFTFGSPSNAPSEGVVAALDLNSPVVKFASGVRGLRSKAWRYGDGRGSLRGRSFVRPRR